jgi:hypothetical protein
MRNIWLLLAASASLGFGQLDPYTVTISASRSTAVQPDQIALSVYVTSGLNTGLNDVVAALPGSGITAANLYSVSTLPYMPQQTLQWAFALTVPLSQIGATIATLTNLQQTVAQNNSGMTLTFATGPAQASPQLLASQSCSIPDLVADARAQAQKLADAAGLPLGQLITIQSGAPGSPVPEVISLIGAPGFPVFGGAGSTNFNCTIVVKFALYTR